MTFYYIGRGKTKKIEVFLVGKSMSKLLVVAHNVHRSFKAINYYIYTIYSL